MSGECAFPGGRPGAEANGRTYPDQPCGADALYERHGCRGPKCTAAHTAKVKVQRNKRRQTGWKAPSSSTRKKKVD